VRFSDYYLNIPLWGHTFLIEQHTLNNVNNCLNTYIYSYLETFGSQSCNLYLNVVHFFNIGVYKTSVAP
jgi:hypothetical protein